jgi:hypothetical protein
MWILKLDWDPVNLISILFSVQRGAEFKRHTEKSENHVGDGGGEINR